MFNMFKGGKGSINAGNVSIQSGGKGSISINGKTYVGNNVQIKGDKVIVDGVVQDGNDLVGPISVIVNGNVDRVEVAAGDIVINGDVVNVSATSGDIEVGGEVRGNVNTVSGDIRCGAISGNVSTISGDIVGG